MFWRETWPCFSICKRATTSAEPYHASPLDCFPAEPTLGGTLAVWWELLPEAHFLKEKWCPRTEGSEGPEGRQKSTQNYATCSMTVCSSMETSLQSNCEGSMTWHSRMNVLFLHAPQRCCVQFLPKSHSHLFCLYIYCCIFWSPRSGVERYNLTYLQCYHWECQGILWCSTCLNFRGNKYKTPLDTIKTSGFNNAELVLSLNDSLCVGIAPQSFQR